MEMTCNRCHRTVGAEDCYCPACGLPQFVYSAEDAAAQGQPDRWNEAARDASVVAWRPAIRLALMLAIPAGILCSGLQTANLLGLIWMAAASAWVVVLYVRSQQAPWITLGAGARIGLVTGILGGWTAVGVTGISLVLRRFFFHKGPDIDGWWQDMVMNQFTHQWSSGGWDSHSIATLQGWFLSPEGRAGSALFIVMCLFSMLLFFSVAGGAFGARLTARSRRPKI
jgi:hypothetical protein